MPLEEVDYVLFFLQNWPLVSNITKSLNLLLMNISLQEISFLKAKLKDAQEKLQVAETKIKVCYDVLMNEPTL